MDSDLSARELEADRLGLRQHRDRKSAAAQLEHDQASRFEHPQEARCRESASRPRCCRAALRRRGQRRRWKLIGVRLALALRRVERNAGVAVDEALPGHLTIRSIDSCLVDEHRHGHRVARPHLDRAATLRRRMVRSSAYHGCRVRYGQSSWSASSVGPSSISALRWTGVYSPSRSASHVTLRSAGSTNRTSST